jgi:hypothetical protein
MLAFALFLTVADPSAPKETTAPAATSEHTKLVRIAVYDLQLTGVPDQWGPLLSHSLTAELRKLQHTGVVSTDEIRTMLEHEANKQLVNCEGGASSCLAEVADALGVDVLITGTVAKVGEEHLFSLKRIDPSGQTNAQQVTRRFAAGNGEELLGAIGPAVAELFPDIPLKKGAVRGVDKEVARRLNPPPLKPWVVVTGGATAGVLALASAGAGVFNAVLASDLSTYKNKANPFVEATFTEKAGAVDDTAVTSWIAGGAAGAVALATGVAALFTDFDPPEAGAE